MYLTNNFIRRLKYISRICYCAVIFGILLFELACNNEVTKTSIVIKGETLDLSKYKTNIGASNSRFGISLLNYPYGYEIGGYYNGKVRINKTYIDSTGGYSYYIDSLVGTISYSSNGLNGEASSNNNSKVRFINYK